MTIRIALAQVTSTEDASENLAAIDRYTSRAAADGARLVVFPEAMMRCFGGASLVEIAQPVDGSWANAVRAIAERADITVVTGMFTPTDDGRVRNTLLVTGAGVDAHYHKIHLFDAFGFAESDTVSPGQDPLVVDIAGVRVGFAICYDLRFPGLFQTMADNGAQLHVISASWGAGPGKVDHWELLARARALDTTTFVAACDQASPVDYRGSAPRGVGHSLVAAPDGGVLGSLGAEPDLLTVDLELDTVDAVRRSLPVLANRRI
ncbi:MAG TPA: carbon-nitrogen hydrolase family protein [Acidothermaceae bacterium]|nr:carbon-nitrogen hydrolase family protein [Acidothermaceae bacterium]